MTSSRWFGYVLLVSHPSEPLVLDELDGVFDAAQPAQLDRDRSYAIDGSLLIAHASDSTGDLEIEVAEDRAAFSSVMTHRQITGSEYGDLWTREVAQEVDRIIRGRYHVERTRWRTRIMRTIVTDQDGTLHITTSSWSRLPLPAQWLNHEHSHLNYGCTAR